MPDKERYVITNKVHEEPVPVPVKFINNISSLSKKEKIHISLSIIYSVVITMLICNLDQFDGLGFISFLMLIYGCFLGTAIYIEKLSTTFISIFFVCFYSLTPLITLTGYEISKMSKLASINLNSISEKKVLDRGVIEIKRIKINASKSHRSWNNLELNKPQANNIILFCNFVNPEDTCPEFEYLNNQEVQIQYVYLEPTKALMLAMTTSNQKIQSQDMLKSYKKQQQTIWLWFIFVIFPAIFYPIFLISRSYWQNKETNQN